MYKIEIDKKSKRIKAVVEGIFEITAFYEDESEIEAKCAELRKTMADMDYVECIQQ